MLAKDVAAHPQATPSGDPCMPKSRLFGSICCGLTLLSLGCGAVAAATEFEWVNRLRAQAGLPALAEDAGLATAAARHAAYLDRHREPGQSGIGPSAHTELPADEGFSGALPADRAVAAGYRHRDVLENVSMGYTDAHSAIDGLMSALYHRLTFLDLEADQLGVAVGKGSRVFVLGRTDLATLCVAPPPEALSRTPLDCLGQPMTRDFYEALCADLPAEAMFRPSHPVACANGVRLDAAYMAGICEQPPPGARFRGHGRYYEPCDNGTRIDARWFNALCERRPADAVARGSGSYFEICEPSVQVGAEWFEALCAALPEHARFRDSGRYRVPCADDTAVRVEYLDVLDRQRRADLPEVVLWPPDGATDIPPAFFIEQPDPLPDLTVAGYPVTLQFNPALVDDVELRAWRISRDDPAADDAPLEVRLLDHETDPNQLLGRHEFALFPLQRLAWGTRYQVEVEALLDGVPRRWAWRFTTRGSRDTLLTAAAASQRFVVRTGVDYLLYLPPRDQASTGVSSSRIQHRRGNRVTLKAVDPNTLRLRVEARLCDVIELHFDDGRRVQLVPSGCAG